MASQRHPSKLTGGCNCAAIKYTITLPEDTVWPLKNNGTCQCTACRKFTGCLQPQSIGVPVASISPPFKSNATYKEWDSGNGGLRGFCTTCGSSLTFNYVTTPESTEIWIGALDEEVLVGKKTGADEDCGKYGKKAIRETDGFGAALVDTSHSGHLWLENAVKGWTDKTPGKKFWQERGENEGFETSSD